MRRETGFMVLFISHNLTVVRYVATHVEVMVWGRIVEQGQTAQVFSLPSSDYTRELLASITGADGESPAR